MRKIIKLIVFLLLLGGITGGALAWLGGVPAADLESLWRASQAKWHELLDGQSAAGAVAARPLKPPAQGEARILEEMARAWDFKELPAAPEIGAAPGREHSALQNSSRVAGPAIPGKDDGK